MKVGTRGSLLARTQTRWVIRALQAAHPDLEVTETVIRTRGDREQQRPLPEIGGKGLFTREIEEALLSGTIDAAVHSLKDLPTQLPDGLIVGAIPAREVPFDAILSRSGAPLADLPEGARVGTSSLRRAAQLRAIRPDLRIEAIRGNLDTRIRKLHEEGWDAILVAAAGLARIGRLEEATEILSPDVMLPAVGQGALAIEMRADDAEHRERFAAIHDPATARAVTAERAFLDALGGGCHVPIAAYAEPDGDGTIRLRGLVSNPDGTRIVRDERTGDDAAAVGRELAARLLDMGAAALLTEENA